MKQDKSLELLTAKDFRPSYKHKTSTPLSGFDIRFFQTHDVDVQVYLPTCGMNLQRGYVWTPDQQRSFIEAVLRGIQFPPGVMVVESKYGSPDKKYKVIDGKQRLNTLVEYFNGEFSIPYGDRDVFISDLDSNLRYILNECMLWVIHYSYIGTDEEINDATMVEIFRNCNFRGTPMDVEHLERLEASF